MKRVHFAAAIVAAPALVAPSARRTRPDAPRAARRLEGDRARRGWDHAPPGHQPARPEVVVLGCDMTGAYITADGGASWRMFNLGSVPTAFAFDPSRPQTLYAGAAAVYRSDDSGRTWRMVLPDPAKNTVARSIGDHGDRVLFTDDPAYPGSGRSVTIHAIAVDEDDSNASTSPRAPPTRRSRVLPPRRRFFSDRPTAGERGRGHRLRLGAGLRAPGGRRREGAASARHRRERRLRGSGTPSWQHRGSRRRALHSGALRPRPALGRRLRLRHAAADPSPERHRGRRAGLRDGGRTWRAANGSLLAAVREVGRGTMGPGDGLPAVPGADRGLRSLPARGLRGPAGHRLPGRGDAPFNGIAKTVDGGRHGASCTRSPTSRRRTSPGRGSSRAPRRTGTPSGSTPLRPRGGAERPGRRYATDLFRTYRTSTAGRTWAQVNSERRGDDRWTTRGLDVTTCYGVHFDPFDPKRMFIPYTDIGLFRSEDGGETWTGSTDRHPARAGGTRPTGSRSTPR